MPISQQAPAPAPAVRAAEPQEEVFHEVVNDKVDLSNTDSMMAIDTLIGMKKGLWEKVRKLIQFARFAASDTGVWTVRQRQVRQEGRHSQQERGGQNAR